MKLVRIHCHTDIDENITEYHLEYHPDFLALFEELGIIDKLDDGIRYEDLQSTRLALQLF